MEREQSLLAADIRLVHSDLPKNLLRALRALAQNALAKACAKAWPLKGSGTAEEPAGIASPIFRYFRTTVNHRKCAWICAQANFGVLSASRQRVREKGLVGRVHCRAPLVTDRAA
jgi:hypothetical protein